MIPTVLIAEHSPLIARQLCDTFEAIHFRVVGVCRDGLSALEQARLHRPLVVTTDMLLPRLGGLQLASTLRRQGNPPAVFFVTAVAARERVEAARLLGARYYALKPIDHEKLSAAAQRIASAGREVHAALGK